MTISVTHTKVSSIPDGADTDLIRPSDWNASHTLTGVGTMAEQNANNVAITGGSVNGTSLGASTAASAKVTTLDIGSGLTLATSAGTAGQVLTSAGAGNVPTWSTNGAGDVVGPASSTDNAVARFDSTTGKLIQNSAVIIDDNGNTSGVRSITYSGAVPASTQIGTMWFDSSTDTLNLQQNNITQQVGEEIYVYGKATNTISGQTLLQAIVKTGAVGASGVITFGVAGSGITDAGAFIGVATEDIATNSFGRVTNFGIVHGINTSGLTYGETWVDGQDIWYNPTTGGLTKTKPSAPNIKIQLGTVINAGSGGSGSFQVLIGTGSSLGGTDDNVQLSSPTGGQLLTYSSTDSYWKNTNLAAGTGISVSNANNGVITVTNSAPDQTVAISAGTGISVSGTYPNFTVTNTSPSSGGTVTSVTGTAPIASSGGNTPAISISQATTSTDGYLSSTDWNTFNGKAPLASPTFTGTVTLPANTITNGFNEITTVTASAPSSTTNFDVISQSIQYYTSNTANNWTLNVRGNSGTSLNTLMATGQTITITFLATNGSTAYYNNAVTIDGNSVTPKWQGGTAPTSGNTSAVDIYTYAIVKTGSAAFTVFASQTQFA